VLYIFLAFRLLTIILHILSVLAQILLHIGRQHIKQPAGRKDLKMKHTPGPWKILPGNERCIGGTVISGANDYRVATATRTPEEYANAHLIAAAPDLVGALEDLTTTAGMVASAYYMSGDPERMAGAYHLRQSIDLARAAIAKVEGK
jgi:hypothetical protein